MNLADSSERLAPWRLQLAKDDYEIEHRPGAKRRVADGGSRPRRSKEEYGVIDDEVSCPVMEGSTHRDAAQTEHRGAVMAFWGSTEAKTRTEHTTPSTVLCFNEEPATPNPFTVEKFLQTKKVKGSNENDPSRWTTPNPVLTTTDTGYWCE